MMRTMNSLPAPRREVPRAHAGFTLIEIVIVMVVIAILALMALPALYGNTTRQQIKESMALANVAKAGVTNYYGAKGEMPAANDVAGVPESNKLIGNYVVDVRIRDGAVTITYGNNAHSKIMGKRLSIRPAYVADNRVVPISWICGNQPVPKGMEVAGNNETNLTPDLLPLECR